VVVQFGSFKPKLTCWPGAALEVGFGQSAGVISSLPSFADNSYDRATLEAKLFRAWSE
jgi:hypothetical protein